MTVDQITFQAQQAGVGAIAAVASSLSSAETRSWHQRLGPFLQTGRPLGCGYLDFGSAVAAIRWSGDASQPAAWQCAHAFVGRRAGLTAAQALELPGLDPSALPGGGLVAVEVPAPGPRQRAIGARARSAEVRPVLIPLLGHVLWGKRRIVMPWQEPAMPEAALWGLIRILEIIEEPQRISFLSYASGSVGNDALPGPFVSFQPGTRPGPPDPGFFRLATILADRFADSPDALREEVVRRGVAAAPERPAKISRLLTLLPAAQPRASTEWWTSTAAPTPKATPAPQTTATTSDRAEAPPDRAAGDIRPHLAPTDAGPGSASRAPGQAVVCPICLGDITDWNTQSPWEWDSVNGKYNERRIPPGLTERQRAPYLRNAYVRCTAQSKSAGQPDDDPHYLPANYGRFGRPVVLGFVGLSMAGKSHLLSAMVAGIVGGDLRKGYQVNDGPLDQARHQAFLDSHVNPLLQQDKVLPGTREIGETDVLEFADAFVMSGQNGQPRPVAFFDIAGGDLASLRKKRATDFLYMADGLFFVVDPVRLNDRWAQDKTFSNVLDIVSERPRTDPVSAAIVLTKADTLRFEEPITRWLRYEPELEPLNAMQFLRESADVYGYLESRNALALAAPYDKCAKATLHVASATGGNGEEKNTVYSRGVRPRRVIRPLAAMLAMTGVLTGPEAEKVGI